MTNEYRAHRLGQERYKDDETLAIQHLPTTLREATVGALWIAPQVTMFILIDKI